MPTKKNAVEKQSVQKYIDVINWKKWEAHNANQLFIEINAGDLLTEIEAGVSNVTTVCNAMNDTMLEGDYYVVASKRACSKLTVRYYCDNLSPERRKYAEVNA